MPVVCAVALMFKTSPWVVALAVTKMVSAVVAELAMVNACPTVVPALVMLIALPVPSASITTSIPVVESDSVPAVWVAMFSTLSTAPAALRVPAPLFITLVLTMDNAS